MLLMIIRSTAAKRFKRKKLNVVDAAREKASEKAEKEARQAERQKRQAERLARSGGGGAAALDRFSKS